MILPGFFLLVVFYVIELLFFIDTRKKERYNAPLRAVIVLFLLFELMAATSVGETAKHEKAPAVLSVTDKQRFRCTQNNKDSQPVRKRDVKKCNKKKNATKKKSVKINTDSVN